MSKKFFYVKDLAAEMEMSPRSVKRWWKKLNTPPTIPGVSLHRWTPEDAEKFLARWKAWFNKHKKKTPPPKTPSYA